MPKIKRPRLVLLDLGTHLLNSNRTTGYGNREHLRHPYRLVATIRNEEAAELLAAFKVTK
jgi:hypothetical protein